MAERHRPQLVNRLDNLGSVLCGGEMCGAAGVLFASGDPGTLLYQRTHGLSRRRWVREYK